MVRPKGGASRRRTAAASRGVRRGREPAKGVVAWRGAALWWMPILPNWNAADGSHQARGALLTLVAEPPSSPVFTHGFCRGARKENLGWPAKKELGRPSVPVRLATLAQAKLTRRLLAYARERLCTHGRKDGFPCSKRAKRPSNQTRPPLLTAWRQVEIILGDLPPPSASGSWSSGNSRTRRIISAKNMRLIMRSACGTSSRRSMPRIRPAIHTASTSLERHSRDEDTTTVLLVPCRACAPPAARDCGSFQQRHHNDS